MSKHVLARALIAVALSLAALVPAKAQNFWTTPGGATAPGAVMMCLDANGNSVPASQGGACIVSGSAVLTSIATNNWPTPGGAVAQGLVLMCLNAQGQAVPATESGTCLPSGGGGGGVSSIADNGGVTLAFSASTGAVTAGCTTATSAQIGCAKFGTGLTVTAGSVVPTFGTAANQVAQGGVITAGGPTGSATVAPIITYNAAGQLTTVSSATITPAVGSITGLGTGVATLLGGNASGTGGPAGTTSPSLTTPTLGAATATSIAIGAGSAITSSGAGGALGSNAFTSTAYAPLASPTFSGTVTMPDSSTHTSSGLGGVTFLGVNQSVPSTYVLGVTGTSQSGSSANGIASWAQTYNTAGNPTAFQIAITNTAVGSNTSSYFMNLFGGSGGSTSEFRIDLVGNVVLGGNLTAVGTLNTGAGQTINWSTHGILSSPAAGTIQLGAADAASPVAQIFQAQGATGADHAGANTTIIGSRATGAGGSGNILIEVGKTATTGSTQNTAYPMLSINAGNATGATVQFGDGTNFTTYDSCTALTTGATGIVACTASDERLKTDIAAIDPVEALAFAMTVPVDVYSFTDPKHPFSDDRRHIGFMAQNIRKYAPKVAETMVGRMAPTAETPDGTFSVDYNDAGPLAIAAIKELKRQFDDYRAGHP